MSKLDRLFNLLEGVISSNNRLQASIEQLVPKEVSMPTMTAEQVRKTLAITDGTLTNWTKKRYGKNFKLARNCYSSEFVRRIKKERNVR